MKKIDRNLPNNLTSLRILLVPVYAALFLMNFRGHMYIAGAVFILASLTDFLDGNLARKYGLVSDYGKFADPAADKILVLTAVVLLCEAGRVSGWSTAVMVSREIIVMSLRNMAVLKNRVLAADIFGKLKTTAQMIAIILMHYEDLLGFLPPAATVCYYAAVVLTIFSGANYIFRNLDVISYGTEN